MSVGRWSQQALRRGFVVWPRSAATRHRQPAMMAEPSRAAGAGADLRPASSPLIGVDTALAAVGGNKGAGPALKAPLADPGPRFATTITAVAAAARRAPIIAAAATKHIANRTCSKSLNSAVRRLFIIFPTRRWRLFTLTKRLCLLSILSRVHLMRDDGASRSLVGLFC